MLGFAENRPGWFEKCLFYIIGGKIIHREIHAMARAKIWKEEQYMGYPIKKFTDGCREEILSAIVKIFHYMWDCCGKRLFVCHLTVYLPEGFNENGTGIIRSALHSWRSAKLHRNIRCEYLWCREEGDCSNHGAHYHIFIIVPGKYIQSGYGICNDLNRLLSYRTGKDSKRIHINPPGEGSFRWGKKVSEKLDNLNDAINWASYLAKVSTKNAPYRKRTYDYSRGFRNHLSAPVAAYTLQEEKMFDEFDLTMSAADWETWGPEDYDARKELNFDPETGGPYFPKPQGPSSLAQKTQPLLQDGATV